MERVTKKKGNKPVIIVISAAAAVIVLAGGYFAYSSWQKNQELNKAEKSAKSFLNYLSKQEFEQLPELLNETSVKESGYDDAKVVEKYQTIFSGIQAQGIKSKNIKVTQEKEGKYTFTYNLEMTTPLGNLTDLSYKTTIQKDTDTYKINWAPNLIFPEMTGQDKISIGVDAANRGEIIDRNGEGLAVNQAFDQVGIVPGKLGDGQEKTNNIKAFSDQFKISVDEIEQKLKQSWVQADSFVPLTVSFEPVTTLPKGAASQDATVRYYPLKEAAAQLVGYVGTITAEDIEKDPTLSSNGVVGKVGLEQAYDKQLRGQDGGSITITQEDGTPKSVLQQVDKKDGEKSS